GAGLVVGFHLAPRRVAAETAAPPGAFAPNAFVRIGTDNTVTIVAKHLEMGQGAYTGLATVLAEELDADWGQVRVDSAPADAARYNNLAFGQIQGTGGSSAIANSFEQLRKAGAAARALLVAAAAQAWNVPAGEITVAAGSVKHAKSKKEASFGQLAAAAAKLPVPAEPKLKDPAAFKLIGSELPRVDTKAKTTGTAQFALDVRLPGMLTAVVARPPLFGATAKALEASKAKAVPGVRNVVQIPSGVAVVAENTWAAMKGREALMVEWDESKAETRGTKELMEEYRKLADQPGAVAAKRGDIGAGF